MKATVLTSIVCLLACAVLLSGCGGGGKYDDVKKVNEEFATGVESFVADIEKASSGKEAAKAIDGFTDVMERLAPKMKKLEEKYPELKDAMKRSEEAGQKMMGAMMKLMQYASDPDVQAAQKRMEEAMSGMN